VTNSGHVVPVNRLYTYVWGSSGADANALRSHISHIRRKLEREGAAPGSIASVPSVGYVFRGLSAESVTSPSVPSAAAGQAGP
jgi:DNA-binding winged helix-turn-helix (wHTH) protein